MKRLFAILTAALLLSVTGCQQDAGLVYPESAERSPVQNLSSSQVAGEPGERGKVLSGGSVVLLRVSKQITLDGDKGGHVDYTYEFADGSKVAAALTLEKGSYKGTKTFTITFDAENKTVNFDPHGSIFSIPAHLDLSYTGLNFGNDVLTAGVNWTNEKNGTFVYMPDDGSAYQPMEYKNIIVNPASGILFVKDARLPHFSRFGFIR